MPALPDVLPDALTIGLVFLLAGAVKGVIGLGLPTVALALLAATLGLEAAMALMLAPSFVTNVWQALAGGSLAMVLRRVWPFLLAAVLAVPVGVALTAAWGGGPLAALLGLLLIAYGLFGLGRPALALPDRLGRWLGPPLGAVNGVLTGLTGAFVVPGVPYLQALGLARGALMQAMGLLFTGSTVALAAALAWQGRFSAEIGLASLLAVAPALAGMAAGAWLRDRLPEARFRTIFFAGLIAMGAYLVGSGG